MTPEWVRDAVFYQIFPDRFAASAAVPKPTNLEPWDSPPTTHGFKGGDLLGIVERLDYLADLGVDAIYFTPIFQSAANHRYHTHDYYQVDPILGGNAALDTLLAAAHRRGMRVVLDGVFNHCSRGFYQFHHLLENGPQSPYLDWFIVHSWPLYPYDPRRPPGYASWWGLPALPKFNTANPAVRDLLWGVGRYWIERGIDGWRLDVPFEIDDDAFWQEFRRRVKDANPEAYLVGEIWADGDRWLRGDQFDAAMNYQLTRACLEFFITEPIPRRLVRGHGYGEVQRIDAPAFGQLVEGLLRRYRPEVVAVQLNLLGSHDTARFLTIARGDESALRLATLFQMTYPGAPCIYYGDEIGLEGGRDPDNRRSMPWDEGRWNQELRAFFRRAIALRRAHPSLRRGSYLPLHAANGVYAFARQHEEETLVVALNAARQSRAVELATGELLPEGAVLESVWEGGTARVERGRLGLRLAPRSGDVYAWRARGQGGG